MKNLLLSTALLFIMVTVLLSLPKILVKNGVITLDNNSTKQRVIHDKD